MNNYNCNNCNNCKFINKNHNKTIIKEKNPTDNKIKKLLNKLKKLYEYGLITKKFLEEKQKEILKIIKIKNSIKKHSNFN